MPDDVCEKCGAVLTVGSWPFCPDHGIGHNSVCPDDYGRDISCETMGHEVVTYRTRSERKRLMKEHKVEEFVRHVGQQGSDKSPHTSRWI